MTVIDTSLSDFVGAARRLLRDTPHFFEVDLGSIYTSTIRLPHPNIDGASLQVYTAPGRPPDATDTERVVMTPLPESNWVVDERNGLLKFTNNTILGLHVLVAGYYYEWFLDEDLQFYAQVVISEHLHGRDTTIDCLGTVETDVIGMGILVRALWSLVTQFSTEVNVTTPEGINIPAGQRFQQVWQLLQFWEGEYTKRAAALNVGLFSMGIYTLRRVSLTTGRYVPVYKPREIDDRRRPVRIYPAILGGQTNEESEDCQVTTESTGYGYGGYEGGWQAIGTGGEA